MGTPIYTDTDSVNCPHAASGSAISTSSKVTISGGKPMLSGDSTTVAGCPFTVPSGKPQPCTTIDTPVTAIKVKIESKDVITKAGAEMGVSSEQAKQGPATIVPQQVVTVI